ncbi:cysteine-rich receptor-like protein kinase 2 [Panicum miliaceum]|uniref:Cysteine-rich receptor-like protein kinase 2 n=1 Tax=Panicum miliaceum TaxID=4540 RepID=A0A3L6QZ19_PANMI|nr:cysteine-rich receptor-like protein kinase 2 [Panicum miliaceum]
MAGGARADSGCGQRLVRSAAGVAHRRRGFPPGATEARSNHKRVRIGCRGSPILLPRDLRCQCLYSNAHWHAGAQIPRGIGDPVTAAGTVDPRSRRHGGGRRAPSQSWFINWPGALALVGNGTPPPPMRSITFTTPSVAARRTFCAALSSPSRRARRRRDIHIHLSNSGTQLARALDDSLTCPTPTNQPHRTRPAAPVHSGGPGPVAPEPSQHSSSPPPIKNSPRRSAPTRHAASATNRPVSSHGAAIRTPPPLALAILLVLCPAASADPRASVAGQACAPGTAVSGSALADNFVPAMDNLNTNVSAHGFGTSAVGSRGPNTVFGLGQCLRDLSPVDCKLCFAEVRSLLPKCYPRVGGRLYLDGCFGRYGNYSFFGEALDAAADTAVCGSAAEGGNYTGAADPLAFGAAVRAALANVTATAAAPGSLGFGAGSAASGGATAFALAQCWESLNDTACAQCLRAASGAMATCAPATEGRALFAGCYIRYSMRRFWNVNATAGSGSSVVLIIAFLASKKRILRRKNGCNSFIDMYGDGLPVRIAQSSLNFKYEELRKATNYFDPSNKLGQGSCGAVYKAVLLDGKEVAVKRLFLNTRQWVDQFFNEVDLISQVRHKNLVRLLGCSMNGPESLLVYEYYFNKSLDLFLFDTSRRRNLTWDLRVDIIQGIAEGLSYLHEESEARIIHRDIKASNILLDDKLKPKITDFGLARAFGEDVTHLTTGVAGTLGYMAPEYIVHGHLTEKADVFSYGVLVLEIVTGKRCSSSNGSLGGQVLLTKESFSEMEVLNMDFQIKVHFARSIQICISVEGKRSTDVWKHYKDNTIHMIVDRSIYEDNIRDEVMHILQIGLLCTQANPDDRPTMGKVVELLRNHRNDLEIVLSDPPFLNVEPVENMQEGEHSRLLSTNSAPSLSGSSRSYLSGR